ncbi:MAG: sugar phosphate isomerase/epimerase [Planctomycetaceae bacterium]|nr:sugar phosphate isomerase/epimerase [Planctomycetaceae bacterium]MBL4885797.1 sugar phosphate isomerase/epimerase [Planctomycetaceae bacterium]
MFIAATTGCFSGLNYQQASERIAGLEYSRIELTLGDDSGDLSPANIAADPEASVTRVREASRLSVCALNVVSDIDISLYPGLFKFAKLLKVTQVTMPSLELGAPFNDETDRLKDLVTLAVQEGIRLSLKTQIGRLTEDPHTAVELCRAVKGLGLTLDPSHYSCGPYRTENYDMVYEYTSHVHLRDSTPDKLQIPVGLGEIDYNRIITQLNVFDYNRAFSVDLIPSLTPEGTCDLEMRRLRMLLESLL